MPPLAPRRLAAAAGLCALALLALRPPPAVAGWRLPVRGGVVRAFAYSARTPFRAGASRGVDFRAAPGSVVRAACSGRVRFAGPVPLRGLGVTLACGRLVATELGLSSLAVRRGALVAAGAMVGRAGEGGLVRLGARRAGERWGYVDPLSLIAPEPLGRAPRGDPPPPLAPPPAGPGRRNYSYVRGRRGGEEAVRAPLWAWVALALLAAGAAGGGLWRAGSLRERWAPSTSPRRSTT